MEYLSPLGAFVFAVVALFGPTHRGQSALAPGLTVLGWLALGGATLTLIASMATLRDSARVATKQSEKLDGLVVRATSAETNLEKANANLDQANAALVEVKRNLADSERDLAKANQQLVKMRKEVDATHLVVEDIAGRTTHAFYDLSARTSVTIEVSGGALVELAPRRCQVFAFDGSREWRPTSGREIRFRVTGNPREEKKVEVMRVINRGATDSNCGVDVTITRVE